MNILMMTNTYSPHVGGVARSVEAFADGYRQQGHQVLIVAPEFPDMPESEDNVIRIPAIQRFNGSDFSVVIPLSRFLGNELEAFEPDIVHSHHPFLIGSIAARVAKNFQRPLVFTHHTMYEQYTHYVPGDSPAMKRFAIKLASSYANLCDTVIAPSESVAEILRQRGVKTAIRVIPTGVDLTLFAKGSGTGFRQMLGIAPSTFLLGHIGRLAPEKNLTYLCEALISVMQQDKQIDFLLVGKGSSKKAMISLFKKAGLCDRLHCLGFLEHPILASAYKALDLFVFTSHSETQGMVISEAMAAKVPVVALDAPGVREVVVDKVNGYLLPGDASVQQFSNAILSFRSQDKPFLNQLGKGCLHTADSTSLARSIDQALSSYRDLLGKHYQHRHKEYVEWQSLMPLIAAQLNIIKGYANAAMHAMSNNE